MKNKTLNLLGLLVIAFLIGCNDSGSNNSKKNEQRSGKDPHGSNSDIVKESFISKSKYQHLALFEKYYQNKDSKIFYGFYSIPNSDNEYKLISIKINSNFNVDQKWGHQGIKESKHIFEGSQPLDIMINDANNVYVLTSEHIYKLNLEGELDQNFGSLGAIQLDFNDNGYEYYFVPKNLRINSKDEFLISGERVKRRNQVFDRFYAAFLFNSQGEPVNEFGYSGYYEQKRWSRQKLFQTEIMANDEIVYSGTFQRLSWGGSDNYPHGTICKLDPKGNYDRNFSSDKGFKDFSPLMPLESGLLVNEQEVIGIVGTNELNNNSIDIYLLNNEQRRTKNPDFSFSAKTMGTNAKAIYINNKVHISSIKNKTLEVKMLDLIKNNDLKILSKSVEGKIKDYLLIGGSKRIGALIIINQSKDKENKKFNLSFQEL